MALPTEVNNSTPVTPNATTGPSYPTGLAANDQIVMFYATDGTIGATPSGWTKQGATFTQGGQSVAIYTKLATGSETGTVVVPLTGTITQGVALMANYRAVTSGMVASVQAASGGLDTDTTSTTISATGGTSLTTTANDLLVSWLLAIASGGQFSGGPTGLTVTQGTATLGTSTQVVGARSGSTLGNLYYRLGHRPVTTGATGAPVVAATAVGANSAAAAMFLQLREASAPTNTPPTANAGADQTNIDPYATVTVSGAGSSDPDGTIASYLWTQVSGPTVTLTGAGSSTCTFTAPAVAGGCTVVLGLTVTDNLGATSTQDTVSIAVNSHNEFVLSGGVWVPLRIWVKS